MLYETSAFAGTSGDPFFLSQAGYFPGYYNLTGKTAVDPRLLPAERTLVLITIGQSLFTNHVSGSYACKQKVHNLSLDNGGVYTAAQPLLGCSLTPTPARESNYAMHLADKIILANKADRIILCPIGIGGTTIAQWASGGVCNERIGVLARRLEAQGYAAGAILWHQGESDHGTAQSSYAAALSSVIGTFRANGLTAPFFPARATYSYGAVDAAVRAAQLGVADGVSVHAGPDLDTLGSANRVDDLHFNQAGASAAADLWLSSIGPFL